ncbi:MAG: alkanal monooxygenase, partial [Frankiales bacterium]|nr:alkanal monooxygenase [Frankiales bacterium]
YERFWVAEHHGMPGIASSAPAVQIAALAARTTRIREGTGGVMLPNHPPLTVAEQFGTLAGLYPGRIDLGIGRAPGTDQRTAQLLRRGNVDDIPGEIQLVRAFFDGPVEGITAVPAAGNAPEVWLLGSSGYSAQLAGLLGLPFAFAHHFSSEHTLPALELYRSTFRPGVLEQPHSMICASVLVADSYERARELSLPGALAFVKLRQGRPDVMPSPEEAAAHDWTPADRLFAEQRLDKAVLGSPTEVEQQLKELLAQTQVDELMVVTQAHALEDRIRSYELLSALIGGVTVGR